MASPSSICPVARPVKASTPASWPLLDVSQSVPLASDRTRPGRGTSHLGRPLDLAVAAVDGHELAARVDDVNRFTRHPWHLRAGYVE